MEIKHILLGAAEAVAWYFFLWVGLDAIKNKRNLWLSALFLLVLFYIAFMLCPWVRHTPAWQQL